MLGMSTRTVQRMADDGRLRVIRIGRLVRVPADALAALLGEKPTIKPKISATERAAVAWLDSLLESGQQRRRDRLARRSSAG